MVSLNVGLLSDTHIPHRLKGLPEAVIDALAGTDVILHAGDVDDPAALGRLRDVAPVHAVRGNFHVTDLSDGGASLPAVVEQEMAGYRVVLTHGHRKGLLGFLLKGLHWLAYWLGLAGNGDLNRRAVRRLAQAYAGADVVVFGHSHRAHVERIGPTLLVNPGAVVPTRGERATVGRMRLGPGGPQVEIIPLEKERR